MLARGYTVLANASEMYIPDADDTEAGAIPVEPPAPEVNIPRMREHWPSLDCVGDVADKLVQVWEDGYTVGNQSFSPLRMWDGAARKHAWEELPLVPDAQKERNYFNTRLGNLADMYWAVKHINKEKRPTSGHDLEAIGRQLLKTVRGKAADLAARRATEAVSQVSQAGEATATMTAID